MYSLNHITTLFAALQSIYKVKCESLPTFIILQVVFMSCARIKR